MFQKRKIVCRDCFEENLSVPKDLKMMCTRIVGMWKWFLVLRQIVFGNVYGVELLGAKKLLYQMVPIWTRTDSVRRSAIRRVWEEFEASRCLPDLDQDCLIFSKPWADHRLKLAEFQINKQYRWKWSFCRIDIRSGNFYSWPLRGHLPRERPDASRARSKPDRTG